MENLHKNTAFMPIPKVPYVAVYGSHGTAWRAPVIAKLIAHGIPGFDPTDSAWEDINADNGDEYQSVINDLVARQHEALCGAKCAIIYVGSHVEGSPTPSHAARAELAFAVGQGIRSFVCLEADLVGRNYLWAIVELYEHVERCDSLSEATARAVQFVRSRGGRA